MQILQRGDIVRFKRRDALCVGIMSGLSLLCDIMPATENIWHRADLLLSMLECANAGLRPDVRIRCWPRFGLMRGNVSGRAPNALLIAVDGRVQREAMLRQFENSFGADILNDVARIAILLSLTVGSRELGFGQRHG
ncbi:hypothetical protein FKW31_02995 [Acetobacter sp. DmW_136]|uniref:hypothetical protein n=1 Tax=Acetobacter sp. DmW_136 TaxID=2591091 RepID=UPI001239EA90|nr:hypothetical protein [Acetobacter sp. DmW_136]KAA8387628.1 hypothetical protein FKW31_02995 [Acetobacter sp. DmW_136]